jgi:hypothetical protein
VDAPYAIADALPDTPPEPPVPAVPEFPPVAVASTVTGASEEVEVPVAMAEAAPPFPD